MVWRLQRPDGVGPYGWAGGARDLGLDRSCIRDPGPPPWDDFPLQNAYCVQCPTWLDVCTCPVDEEVQAAWDSKRALCGFPSREAARGWFNLIAAARRGYRLVHVPAKKVWHGKSRTQLLFIPLEVGNNE